MALRPVPVNSGLNGIKGVSPLIPPYFVGEKAKHCPPSTSSYSIDFFFIARLIS
uniref:Uncharacterized protein n=1 Tax=Klebsiella pneumoniae TaxID=573 RepID=A0A8B0SS64_KLEPN|nr:hypothetical protein [Klebsiella pneumoniae]